MLSIFKPKLFLKDLIPDNYVDIHSHLLPAIDDGAKNIEETKFLISELIKMGFSQFITTPHIFNGVWDNTKKNILSKLTESQKSISEKTSIIKLNAAAEYMLDEPFAVPFHRVFVGEKWLRCDVAFQRIALRQLHLFNRVI